MAAWSCASGLEKSRPSTSLRSPKRRLVEQAAESCPSGGPVAERPVPDPAPTVGGWRIPPALDDPPPARYSRCMLTLTLTLALTVPLADPLPPGASARLGSVRWRGLFTATGSGGTARITFTPDGRSVVALLRDGSLAWFDADDGRVTRRLRGPRPFGEFCLTPDGRTLLSADADYFSPTDGPGEGVRVWDLAGGAGRLVMQVSGVCGLCSDGLRFACEWGERDQYHLAGHDLATGRKLWKQDGAIRSILGCPAVGELAVREYSGHGHTNQALDLATGKLLRQAPAANWRDWGFLPGTARSWPGFEAVSWRPRRAASAWRDQPLTVVD